MTKYYWVEGRWAEQPPVRVIHDRAPAMWGDIPPYKSPLGTGIIDGRRARREDLARNNCREVDPSERLDLDPKTEKQAAAERASLDARQEFSMSTQTKERLLKGNG